MDNEMTFLLGHTGVICIKNPELFFATRTMPEITNMFKWVFQRPWDNKKSIAKLTLYLRGEQCPLQKERRKRILDCLEQFKTKYNFEA